MRKWLTLIAKALCSIVILFSCYCLVYAFVEAVRRNPDIGMASAVPLASALVALLSLYLVWSPDVDIADLFTNDEIIVPFVCIGNVLVGLLFW